MLSFPAATSRRRPLWRRLVFVYGAYALLMFALQRHLLFPRHLLRSPAPRAELPDVEELPLEIPGGVQEALFMRAPAKDGAPTPVVIFAHGNGETIDDWPLALDAYRELGVSVLIPEYRGYGHTSGEPSQDALIRDFEAQYDRLVMRPDVDRTRVVFHGRSLGGGVVTALAARRPPAALVLQSTFASVVALARQRFLPGFLVRDPFDSLSVMPTLSLPVFIAHGRQDPLVPFTQAQALSAAARQAEFHEMDCTHADCPPDWQAFMRDVAAFLRSHRIVR